jgi:hypothetical protein
LAQNFIDATAPALLRRVGSLRWYAGRIPYRGTAVLACRVK